MTKSKENEILFLHVREIVARTFQVKSDNILPETGPESIERWDSLGHLVLMMEIEGEFNVRFSVDQITSIERIGDLIALLASMDVHG
jgi:acyl carrier protein